MEPAALVDALEKALVRRGVHLREVPPTEGRRAGHCVLRGVPTVFVPEGVELDARAEVLLLALRWIGPGDQWLPPAIRARL